MTLRHEGYSGEEKQTPVPVRILKRLLFKKYGKCIFKTSHYFKKIIQMKKAEIFIPFQPLPAPPQDAYLVLERDTPGLFFLLRNVYL